MRGNAQLANQMRINLLLQSFDVATKNRDFSDGAVGVNFVGVLFAEIVYALRDDWQTICIAPSDFYLRFFQEQVNRLE